MFGLVSSSSKAESSSSVVQPIPEAPKLTRYETVLQDEERYQAKQYPTPEQVPGCMQLFDEFLMAYTLVPHLPHLYRYGEFVNADWKWQDFKFCLSMKSEETDQKRQLWIKRRAEWWAQRRINGSSEDVWDIRTEPPANFPPAWPDAEENPNPTGSSA